MFLRHLKNIQKNSFFYILKTAIGLFAARMHWQAGLFYYQLKYNSVAQKSGLTFASWVEEINFF